jgi:hypothetical protein
VPRLYHGFHMQTHIPYFRPWREIGDIPNMREITRRLLLRWLDREEFFQAVFVEADDEV